LFPLTAPAASFARPFALSMFVLAMSPPDLRMGERPSGLSR
jgi:hypothetical protein